MTDIQDISDRVQWTKGYKAGIEDERNHRKVRQTPYYFPFLAGVGVGTLSVCFFFLALVLIDKM